MTAFAGVEGPKSGRDCQTTVGLGAWDTLLVGATPQVCRCPPDRINPTVSATLAYPFGPTRVDVSAFHALYRGVPVSPDFSYRDLTVKSRVQDITASGTGAFLAIAF